jgi:hypothetical protein
MGTRGGDGHSLRGRLQLSVLWLLLGLVVYILKRPIINPRARLTYRRRTPGFRKLMLLLINWRGRTLLLLQLLLLLKLVADRLSTALLEQQLVRRPVHLFARHVQGFLHFA